MQSLGAFVRQSRSLLSSPAMEKITDVRLEKITSSNYIQPLRMRFKQEGKERAWDMIKTHDSVSVLLVHRERKGLVVVRQFRPPVFLSAVCGASEPTAVAEGAWEAEGAAVAGLTYELCAGIVDKPNASLKQIASEEAMVVEILEETGYSVGPERLESVTSFKSGVGTSGATAHLFYAELTEEDKAGKGGGVGDNERLEVEVVGYSEVERLALDGTKPRPAAFVAALLYFLSHKLPAIRQQDQQRQ